MPKIKYIDWNPHGKTVDLINVCNDIIMNYQDQGFVLTLRQLYYQLVSRNIIENNEKEYTRLGNAVSNARRAGMIDWNAIEDRTRYLRTIGSWDSVGDIIFACSKSFHMDMWKNQKHRPEVWIEKDALVGVIEPPCNNYDVPFLSCRGYVSDSEMWAASQRIIEYIQNGQTPVIFHLGDHDPSGIDMTRDIEDRLSLFIGLSPPVLRLALNIKQIEIYNPPPNPAKLSDSRSAQYINLYGENSYELDALEPSVISELVADNIKRLISWNEWDERTKEINVGKNKLEKIARRERRV